MDAPVDYSTTLGMKQWAESKKKLGNELFNGSISGLHLFLDRMKTRAEVSGSKNLTKINGKSLFNEYGRITIEEFQNNVKIYFKLDNIGDINTIHKEQLTQQMIVCINQSSTSEFAMKVQTSGEEYKIKVTSRTHTGIFQHIPVYLKIMISRITIESRSTVIYIRSALSELDNHLGAFNNDITKLNDFVQLQLNALEARHDSTKDIMVNLFEGYKSVTNGQFKK